MIGIRTKPIGIWIALLIILTACGQEQGNEHPSHGSSLLLISQEGMTAHGFGRYTYRYTAEDAAEVKLSLERSHNGKLIQEEDLSIDQFIQPGELELGFDFYPDDQDALVWSIRLGDEQQTITTSNYTKACIMNRYQIPNFIALEKSETFPIINHSCQTQNKDEYSFVLQLELESDFEG